MVESTSPRTPSGAEKALIVALLLYAVAVVGPDTFRPLFHEGTTRAMRWYPIATVGFEADNNGKVISVEEDGPADRAGLKQDDQIDLGSVQPDRRAINKFVYVAHGTPIEMVVQRGANQRVQVAIKPESERLGGWDAASLLMAQASALFFIALCAYLIWHRATWSTWGFFLYGMWFNSGQYFVWYANLPVAGLVVFDLLQAAAQALALTGFLAFAMFFPDEQTPGWRSSHRLALLVGVFAVLFVSGLLSFCNFFFGWRTEAMYRVYYALTWIAYLLAVWFFVRNFRRLPGQRARMRWIVAGGLIGLPLFLLADIYEATGLFRVLAPGLDRWIYQNDWVLNLMYAGNVFLPAAVIYTALHHEVMSVRFAVTRAVVLSGIFFACIAALHLPSSWLEETMKEHEALAPLALPISLLVAGILALIHNPLHGVVERLFAPRWHRAKVKLEALAKRLVDDEDLTATDVDRALVEETASALRLESAALLCRQPNDVFVTQRTLHWPPRAQREFECDHPWVCTMARGPVSLADPDDAPDEPELAVPIRGSSRHPAPRVMLYGHHITRERIDPDEVGIIDSVSRAAGLAYMRLDYETPSHPTPSPQPAPTGQRRADRRRGS